MWRIPLSDLTYDAQEEEAVLDVLRSRWLSMGPRTEEFEARVAAYLGVEYALAVANGTCALELAHKLVGDVEKPWVAVVPDITFVATANSVVRTGGHVELAAIRSASAPVLDASDSGEIIRKAHEIGATAVLCPVHYAGFNACSDEVMALRDGKNVVIVEDAAHAIGARHESGRMLGTIGDVGCFSFFANKNLATGEGGLVVTSDPALAARMKLLRSHGMTSLTYQRHKTKGHGYDVLEAGHNYRITEITAALALVQLSKLDAGNERRRQLYKTYRDAFHQHGRFLVPWGDQDEEIDRSSCHIFPLVCETSELRDKVREALNDAGIQTSHHYPSVHSLTYYQKYKSGDDTISLAYKSRSVDPRADDFSSREITLPLHPQLKDREVEEIVEVVLNHAK